MTGLLRGDLALFDPGEVRQGVVVDPTDGAVSYARPICCL
jgi:hypothetical protein